MTIIGRPGTLPQGPAPEDDAHIPEEPGARTTLRGIPGRRGAPTPRVVDDLDRRPAHRPGPATGRGAELMAAIEAARGHREDLLRKPHVLDVRGGYKFVGGRITDQPAVVVVVDRKVEELSPQEPNSPRGRRHSHRRCPCRPVRACSPWPGRRKPRRRCRSNRGC